MIFFKKLLTKLRKKLFALIFLFCLIAIIQTFFLGRFESNSVPLNKRKQPVLPLKFFQTTRKFYGIRSTKKTRRLLQPRENEDVYNSWKANFKTGPRSFGYVSKKTELSQPGGKFDFHIMSKENSETEFPSGVSRSKTARNSKRQQRLPFKWKVKYLNNVIRICDSNPGKEELKELNENQRYVFFIPHTINEKAEIDDLAEKDQQSLSVVSEFLDTFPEFDGATCFMESKKNFLFRQVNDSWCRYRVRESSLIIRNTGPWFDYESYSFGPIQQCNITKGPFLIRKNIFENLGWISRYGKASNYDFFIRSKGKLRIARLSGCLFSDDLWRIDRGSEEGIGNFPDYFSFGDKHGILRIVMEDRVEWTKCVADSTFCKEEPFIWPKSLPRAGMPLCCSHALDRMLRDMVCAINKVGLRYRLIFGTLLGAIRNKAIIPWTYDVDIALERTLLRQKNWSRELQKVLRGRYYVGMSFVNMPRVIPLIPAYITVNTTSFFNGSDDISGERFFSKDIMNAMEQYHAVGMSWRDRGYVDLYEAPEIWWNGSSLITINGQKYISIRDINYELNNWYGKDYMTPVLRGKWIGQSDAGNLY